MSLYLHQTQVPLGPVEKLPVFEEHHSLPEVLWHSVQSWIDQGALGRLHLQDIDFEVLQDILGKLYILGIKPRYDWDSESHTVIMRTVTALHEAPGMWFAREATDFINQKLAQDAICGIPWLDPNGTTGVQVGPSTGQGSPSSIMPDQSLCLMQVDADGNDVYVQEVPRIVLETSSSESLEHVINKAFKYLYETDYAIQAVVICNFTNTPSRPVDGHKSTIKLFKAEIAVWTREESGNLAIDYPHDRCYGGDKHNIHDVDNLLLTSNEGSNTFGEESRAADNASDLADQKSDLGTDESNGGVGGSNSAENNSDIEEGSTDSSSTLSFNPNAQKYSRRVPGDPHHKQWIYLRSSTWTTVYDESITAGQEPEPVLELDVYDILRPCSQLPGDRISSLKRAISIPLGVLRKRLVVRVKEIRNTPQYSSIPFVPHAASLPRPRSPTHAEKIHPPKKKQRIS